MKVTYDEADFGALLGVALGAVLGAVLAGALCRPRGCAKWQDSQLKADNDRLREALKTYATNDYDFDDDCSGGESGQIARDALALQK